MPIKLIKPVKQLFDNSWKNSNQQESPFLTNEFFKALEESHVIGEKTGWDPLMFHNENSKLFTFSKSHSYGEYIFDWDWANAYERHGHNYYPKLTSMIPFTSVTTKHFLGKCSKELMDSYEYFYKEGDYSSSHFLFLDQSEIDFFKSYDYLIRDSFQYHFINERYESFDYFLSQLKSRKAKQIKKERAFPAEFSFHEYSGENLTLDHAQRMYQFYLTTVTKKGAVAYLNEDFFKIIFSSLKKQIFYVEARFKDKLIAGSLYFFSSDKLFGRYWGAIENHPNLHFELCYYRGIELAIKNKLKIFEAGAQGEHKIARGFRPVKTFSAHKMKNSNFHDAIKKYISDERIQIDSILPELSKGLPFKKD
jgi:predicted N-acyltransferase